MRMNVRIKNTPHPPPSPKERGLSHCGLDPQSRILYSSFLRRQESHFFFAGDPHFHGNDNEDKGGLRAESPTYISVGQRPTQQEKAPLNPPSGGKLLPSFGWAVGGYSPFQWGRGMFELRAESPKYISVGQRPTQ